MDQTPGTVMCVVGLGTAVAKQYGAEAGARTSLPIMTPCLAAPALTPQQYATAMRCVLLLSQLESHRASENTCLSIGPACMPQQYATAMQYGFWIFQVES